MGAHKMDKRKAMVTTLVLVLVLVVVAAIWFLKNDHGNVQDRSIADTDDAFALEATAIDLEELFSYSIPIIIDFGSDACIPCKQMAPVLAAINEQMRGKAFIKFVDAKKYGRIAADFRIQTIPSQIFINADKTPYSPKKTMDVEFVEKRVDGRTYTLHQGGLTEAQLRLILADMGVTDK